MTNASAADVPRTEVVSLLLEVALARASFDLPAQRRCADRLRGLVVTRVEQAQAEELAEACEAALRPAREHQCEARRILLPHLTDGLPRDATWSHIWAALSDAERVRLLEIRDWLREPIRSWLGQRAS